MIKEFVPPQARGIELVQPPQARLTELVQPPLARLIELVQPPQARLTELVPPQAKIKEFVPPQARGSELVQPPQARLIELVQPPQASVSWVADVELGWSACTARAAASTEADRASLVIVFIIDLFGVSALTVGPSHPWVTRPVANDFNEPYHVCETATCQMTFFRRQRLPEIVFRRREKGLGEKRKARTLLRASHNNT